MEFPVTPITKNYQNRNSKFMATNHHFLLQSFLEGKENLAFNNENHAFQSDKPEMKN